MTEEAREHGVGISSQEFVAKWSDATPSERASSQTYFEDLRLLDRFAPTNADLTGDFYTFEKGALAQ